MNKLSKKKQAAKRKVAKIKKELIESGHKCFFSGENGMLDAFHICPVGTHPEHETNPRNIVLAKREYNDIWVDRGTVEQILTIPNVHRGFNRMNEVDKLYFNKKVQMVRDNVSPERFSQFFNNLLTNH